MVNQYQMTDIDIDLPNRELAVNILPCINACVLQKGIRSKHPTGIYLQDIPVHPLDNLASLDYITAEKYGYTKIDLLQNTIYIQVKNEQHLQELLDREPIWELFEDETIVRLLAQIGEHFDIVTKIQPKSIVDLAVILALMRPGKRHLLNSSRDEIDKNIWEPTDGYYFKKAHAIAYAASIVVQLNLLVENL